MLKLRDALEPADKASQDSALTEKAHAFIIRQGITAIHSYIPMGNEINLFPLLNRLMEAGVIVIEPRSLRNRKMQNLVLKSTDDLEAGIFGTRHPANSYEFQENYDLVLIPGLAFDLQGFRLGYGAGYYDAFLSSQPNAIKLGLCYPFQVVVKVPVEPHDIRVDTVIY